MAIGTTMTKTEIQADLLRFVCRNFLVDESEVIVDDSLVDQGIIDSFGLIEIASYMRSKYGVDSEESDMNRSNFGSLSLMAEYVSKKSHG
jgi:acyl carrier protein